MDRGGLALALVVLTPLTGTFQADFRTPGSDSTAADRVLRARFSDRSTSTIDVVWRAAAGARSPLVRTRIDTLLADAAALKGIGDATRPEISPDAKTAAARLQIDAERDSDVPARTGERLVSLARDASRDGLQVAMSGWAISNAKGNQVSPEFVGFRDRCCRPAADVRLAVGGRPSAAHGALRARIGTRLVGTLAALMDVPDFATAVAGMMVIGVGIDYALLVITRFRGSLAAGASPRDAVAEATATAGRRDPQADGDRYGDGDPRRRDRRPDALVPAIMQLLGRANWWLPGWLERLLPRAAPMPRAFGATAPQAADGRCNRAARGTRNIGNV